MNLFNKIWYHKHPLFYLLAPFSGFYRLILFFKHLAYQLQLKKITHPPVPTIVVGNLTVGGTGKTPLIISLATFLSHHGYKPGIVSRGYGGKPAELPMHVDAHSNPLQAGDESLLIAQKTGCPVVVDPNRVRAARSLLATYDCNVILSDDGLQHTALGRDIEIVVVDGMRRFGNGWCLPAGPLREPVHRLKKVDFIVVRGAKTLDIKQVNSTPIFAMYFIPGQIYNLKEPNKIFPLKEQIHAVAGIGNPQAFFDQLRTMGLSIIEHPFPDHHIYTAQDLDFGPDATLIMTEKDAVKCEPFSQNNHWCLPVLADCDSMPPLLLDRINHIRSANIA